MGPEDTPHLADPAHASVYPYSEDSATPRLSRKIAEEIAQIGPLPFSRFMELALYDAEGGYYSDSPQARTGREGDFFTSVSVGPLFGRLLAHRIHSFWVANGRPTEFAIVEAGAHDGTLAKDIFAGACDFSDTFQTAIRYHLIESSSRLRELHSLGQSYGSVDELPHINGLAVFLSNELFDAFPVNCFKMTKSGWQERRVVEKNGKFRWKLIPLSNHPSAFNSDFSIGTLAEIRPGIANYISSIFKKLPHSLFITIDYGFARPELYHKDRIAGTLSAYRDHQRIDNVLESPGFSDLTTHVDFTELAECCSAAGASPQLFASQASYFTSLSRNLLLDIEKSGKLNPSLIRQFQSLTHPGIMGRSFQVFEAISGDLKAEPPLQQEDLDHRLALLDET